MQLSVDFDGKLLKGFLLLESKVGGGVLEI
jgi:hypothetical protein